MALQALISYKEDIRKCIALIPENPSRTHEEMDSIIAAVARHGMNCSLATKISNWLKEKVSARMPLSLEKRLLDATVALFDSLVGVEFATHDIPSYLKVEKPPQPAPLQKSTSSQVNFVS